MEQSCKSLNYQFSLNCSGWNFSELCCQLPLEQLSISFKISTATKVFLELQSIFTSNEKYLDTITVIFFPLYGRASVGTCFVVQGFFTSKLRFLLFICFKGALWIGKRSYKCCTRFYSCFKCLQFSFHVQGSIQFKWLHSCRKRFPFTVYKKHFLRWAVWSFYW